MKLQKLMIILMATCLSMPMATFARELTEEEIEDVLANPDQLAVLLQGATGEAAAQMLASLAAAVADSGMGAQMQSYAVASFVTMAMEVLGPEQSSVMVAGLAVNPNIPASLKASSLAAATLVASAAASSPQTAEQGQALVAAIQQAASASEDPVIIASTVNPVGTLGEAVVQRLAQDFPVIQRGVTAFAATQVTQPADAGTTDDPGTQEPAPAPTQTTTTVTTPPPVLPPPTLTAEELEESSPTGPTLGDPPVIPTPYAGQS